MANAFVRQAPMGGANTAPSSSLGSSALGRMRLGIGMPARADAAPAEALPLPGNSRRTLSPREQARNLQRAQMARVAEPPAPHPHAAPERPETTVRQQYSQRGTTTTQALQRAHQLVHGLDPRDGNTTVTLSQPISDSVPGALHRSFASTANARLAETRKFTSLSVREVDKAAERKPNRTFAPSTQLYPPSKRRDLPVAQPLQA